MQEDRKIPGDEQLLLAGESGSSSDEPPPGKITLDSSGQEIPPAQPAQALNYQTPSPGALDPTPFADEVLQHRIRNYFVPIGFVFVSLLVLILPILMMPAAQAGPVVRLLNIRSAWDIGITLMAGMVLTWIDRGMLGEFHTAVLKLVAVAISRFALSAIVFMPNPGNIGLLFIGFLVSLPLFVLLIRYLFEFDFHETLVACMLITFMRWISYFGLRSLLG